MKKFLVAILSLTLLIVVLSFCTLWLPCCTGYFQPVLPFIPLYFCIITILQHYTVVKSIQKTPRTFIRNFMGVTIGTLFLSLAVLCLWAMTHLQQARTFLVVFCICYVVYLVFETASLLHLIRRLKREQK